MGDGRKKRNRRKNKTWEELRAELPLSEQRMAAYGRLMEAEQRLYWLWQQRSNGEMDWAGEALGSPVEEDGLLWLAGLGEKVAALGGHLELVAVLPVESLTLLREPGLSSLPESPSS